MDTHSLVRSLRIETKTRLGACCIAQGEECTTSCADGMDGFSGTWQHLLVPQTVLAGSATIGESDAKLSEGDTGRPVLLSLFQRAFKLVHPCRFAGFLPEATSS